MPKFFVESEKIEKDKIIIDGEDVNHIIKVLRLDRNDIITVCDGKGIDYKVQIIETNKKQVKTRILESCLCENEPSIDVTLYQGIPKASKMEYIIQKTTELGINKIVPVSTQRTIVKMEDKKTLNNKLDRWRKIAVSAAKQCNRGRIPQITLPMAIDEAINEMSKKDLSILCYENEKTTILKDIIRYKSGIKSIGVFIGPEGGLDEIEVQKAMESGIDTISLGKRILRTETAGVAVLAILMYELDNL